MVAADEFGMTFGPEQPAQSAFEAAIASGDQRQALEAMRDFLSHELSGHRCKTCQMSQLRTGDTAALMLRLQKVLEELKALPAQEDANPVDEIRARRNRKAGAA